MRKPSDEELRKLKISSETYIENDFFIAKVAGICKWHLSYSIFYFTCMVYGVITSCGFIYCAWIEGEKEAALENLHFVPLIFNMGSQAAAYHYNQDEYLELFRTIDGGFFDYEGTIDEEMEEFIIKLKNDARNRKRIFGKFYTVLLVCAHLGQILKKPLSFILTGKGKKEVDGENNMIWETPYGMYLPCADWWPVYVSSTIVNYCACNLTSVTAIGSVITYQYISEELLAEYAVVSKTLESCVRRAERLYVLRKSEGIYWRESGKELTVNDCLIRCLNLSVKHHLQVLRMTDVFKRMMNIPLFMVIYDGGLVLCISAYLIISVLYFSTTMFRVMSTYIRFNVSMNLKFPMPMVIAAEAILCLIFCYYGEKITEAAHNVGDSIYNSERWIQHSGLLRPFSLIIKTYCDLPNELSAGGFTAVNHDTFANVLSTAYSYIGFLLST